MASMGGAHQLNYEALVRAVKSTHIVNRLLIAICVAERLPKNGLKADLQNRIVNQIIKHSKDQNVERFERLKRMILDPSSAESTPPITASPLVAAPQPPAPSAIAMGSNSHKPQSYGLNPMAAPTYPSPNTYIIKGNPRIEFKTSPFYVIREQLNSPAACEVMAQHRHTVKITLQRSMYPVLDSVAADPTLRVMVFGAADGHGLRDVAFPHQSEIKVNGGEVKANLRGLKNKPGSTRPVDITNELRLNASAMYNNSVEMTYALTQTRFYIIIYVVKAVSVSELARKLEVGKKITEESVVTTMVTKSRDADIVATASVLSLKCPLSTLRIDLPCRSIACKHNQCFDATSYLQLQEQGPTWLCPICNNPAVFENLAVDEYVKNILRKTSRSIDQVTIQPDGRWELHTKKEVQPMPRSNGYGDDSDDDLVEVSREGDSIRMNTPKMPINGGQSSHAPSSVVSRESSTVTGKRPRQEVVIDLTSSGDEDDEPLLPVAKRQNTSNGTGAGMFIPPYRPPPHNPYGSRT